MDCAALSSVTSPAAWAAVGVFHVARDPPAFAALLGA